MSMTETPSETTTWPDLAEGLYRNMSARSDVVRELEATTRAVLAADDFAEAAMRHYTWERRGWLGRLVRTPSPSAKRRQESARTGAPPAMPARRSRAAA